MAEKREQTQINAVEMVRHIRDEQARLLEGKSGEEIIAFFRRAGKAARQKAKRHAPPQQDCGGGRHDRTTLFSRDRSD